MKDEDCFVVKITKPSQDKFVEFVNGQWREMPLPPGTGLAINLSVKESNESDDEILSILSRYREMKNIQPVDTFVRYQQYIEKLGLKNHVDNLISWENRLNKLGHKLEAIKYHQKKFANHQQEIRQKYENDYTNSIVELEELDQTFIFEIESFLFQSQSALEILAQLIALGIQNKTFDSYGQLLKRIRDNALEDNRTTRGLIKLINANNKWYDNFSDMRNLITHWGNLLNFTSTLHRPSIDNEYVVICYPKMPNGKKVTAYMEEIWENIAKLVEDVGIILKNNG